MDPLRKINPNSDTCPRYKLDRIDLMKAIHKDLEIAEQCWSCKYNLFAICWIEEYQNDQRVVVLALDGRDWAKQELHNRLDTLEKQNIARR